MKKQLAVGLTVATLSFGIVVEPFNYNQSKAVAVNFPSFEPRLDIQGNKAHLYIPKDLIEAVLRQALKVNEQSLKDTDFNRFTLKNTDCKVVGDKLQVSGVVQVEHRELIARNPITGKKHYSPWVSASGQITQLLGVQVRNNKTVVVPIGETNIAGLEGRWYAELVSLAGPHVGPAITPRVAAELSRFNGLDIREFAMAKGSPLIASKLGINEGAVKTALQRNIGPINAGFTANSEFVIMFTFPQLQ